MLFTHLQQKDISGFLTYLWQTDPFKAKWSILAKAYSVIRDHEGKEKAPLDGFLSINADFIGVVDPESYLAKLGWQISVDGDGQIVLCREFEVDINSLGGHLLTTNASVNDVVRNSYLHAYIVGGGPLAAANGHGAALSMATSTQPSSNVADTARAASSKEDDVEAAEVEAVADDEELLVMVSDDGKDDQADTEEIADSEEDGHIQPTQVTSPGTTPSYNQSAATTTLALSPSAGSDHLSTPVLQSMNNGLPDPAVDPPVSSLANTAFRLSGEYPFVSDFDPDMPSLLFDPFMGNGFNTFNMGDWVNEDVF